MVDVATSRPRHPAPHRPSAADEVFQGILDRSLRVRAHTPSVGETLRTAGRPCETDSEQKRGDHQRLSATA